MLKIREPAEDVVEKWYFQRSKCLPAKILEPRKERDLSQATAEANAKKVRCKSQTNQLQSSAEWPAEPSSIYSLSLPVAG